MTTGAPTTLLSIDPGLDATGVALFNLDQYRDSPKEPGDALLAMIRSDTLRTDTAEPMPTRLADLRFQLSGFVGHPDAPEFPNLIYIEEPAYTGKYFARGINHASMSGFWQALGVIKAWAGPLARTIEVRASNQPKATRQGNLSMAARQANYTLPTGPRGGKLEDEWDAIWMGWWVMLNGTASMDARKLKDAA